MFRFICSFQKLHEVRNIIIWDEDLPADGSVPLPSAHALFAWTSSYRCRQPGMQEESLAL